ncbi:caspase-6-like [Styela clava]
MLLFIFPVPNSNTNYFRYKITKMAWEAPFGIMLHDAYYDVMDKLSNNQWFEFARICLDLKNQIDDITKDYATSGIREQKYQMCRIWESKLGKFASVEHLYDLLNYFLRPKEYPSKPTPMLQPQAGMPEKVMLYCSRVGKIEVVFTENEEKKSSKEFLSAYEKKYGKGKVIIFNNENFMGTYTCRKGSKVDVENMERLWKDLGNEVTIFLDLTAENMKTEMENFAKNTSKNYDYFAVIVSSHGNSEKNLDYILGTDEKELMLSEVLDIFNNKNAPEMIGIPKLLFFQTSRGMYLDHGCLISDLEQLEIEDGGEMKTEPTPENKSVPIRKSAKSDEEKGKKSSKERVISASGHVTKRYEEPQTVSQPDSAKYLPTVSDMLVCHSTILGYHSFRNSLNGSWFLNAVTNVFMKHARSEHVVDLMVKVNEAMAENSSMARDPKLSNCKCMSEFQCTFRKRLYLLNAGEKK